MSEFKERFDKSGVRIIEIYSHDWDESQHENAVLKASNKELRETVEDLRAQVTRLFNRGEGL